MFGLKQRRIISVFNGGSSRNTLDIQEKKKKLQKQREEEVELEALANVLSSQHLGGCAVKNETTAGAAQKVAKRVEDFKRRSTLLADVAKEGRMRDLALKVRRLHRVQEDRREAVLSANRDHGHRQDLPVLTIGMRREE
jgi:hypothetical protein